MSESSTFLYFAYGSNMLSRRLMERTPSARFVTVAALRGYELCWHKVSRDGSAKCDVVPVPSPDRLVYGVVFEINLSEMFLLDRAEGIGMGYKEKSVEVHGAAGALQARTYQATNTDRLALPYTWYKALVVAGAREHHLPEPYIRVLESAKTKVDRDEERTAANLQLAGAG